ncbi:unnamed protein product [Phaeothamnion confervicola]
MAWATYLALWTAVLLSIIATGALEGTKPYSRLSINGNLDQGQHLVALSDDDDELRLDPSWQSDPTAGCGPSAPCFLYLTPDGELAVFSGVGPSDPAARKLRTFAAAAEGGAVAVRLIFGIQGDLVLRALPTGEKDRNFRTGDDVSGDAQTLWRAGSALPDACTPESECGAGAFAALLPDGAVSVHRGLSAAMAAYISVGLPAVQRLQRCLFHNDFTATTGQGIAAVTAAAAAREPPGACYIPPALGLITFPNSGTSFTLAASSSITSATTFAVYPRDAPCLTDDCQNICGKNACTDLGMCQLHAMPGRRRRRRHHHRRLFSVDGGSNRNGTVAAQPAQPAAIAGGRPPPPPGKGALLKSHVAAYGSAVLCGPAALERFATALRHGESGQPLPHYGFVRLFRNPFDNVVARFHLLAARKRLVGIKYDRTGFLHENGHFPRRDIHPLLSWHLLASIALRRAGLPTALLTYESIYEDPVKYMRAVLGMLGWSEVELPDAEIQRLLGPRIIRRDYARYRGEALPAYVDDWYEPSVVRYMAGVIDKYVMASGCFAEPVCVRPDVPPVVVLKAPDR